MTMINPFQTDHFPADFTQLYGLGYAEMCVILEAVLDGTRDRLEGAELYMYHRKEHAERTERLAKEITQAVWADINSARSE